MNDPHSRPVPADAWQYLQLAGIAYRMYLRRGGDLQQLRQSLQYGRHALDHGAQISALVTILERIRGEETR